MAETPEDIIAAFEGVTSMELGSILNPDPLLRDRAPSDTLGPCLLLRSA